VYPQLVHFGRFFLPTYGFLVSLGVLVGLWVSVRNSERLGIDGEKAWNLGILVVLCGILGAKVLYIINDWSIYAAHPGDIFSIATLQAGGVFSGGLIAAFLAAWWYVRKHHLPPLAPAMRSRRGWRWDTRLAASDALPPAAATGKRRIISGAWFFAIRWRIRLLGRR
jgi:phosphatidylglycerol:prolipoprotein diacylglycerol transferase